MKYSSLKISYVKSAAVCGYPINLSPVKQRNKEHLRHNNKQTSNYSLGIYPSVLLSLSHWNFTSCKTGKELKQIKLKAFKVTFGVDFR